MVASPFYSVTSFITQFQKEVKQKCSYNRNLRKLLESDLISYPRGFLQKIYDFVIYIAEIL